MAILDPGILPRVFFIWGVMGYELWVTSASVVHANRIFFSL